MKVVYVLMSVVSLLMFFVFLIIANRDWIQSPILKAIGDVVTIFIGIMTLVSGIVSINVMRTQEDIQKQLLEAQKSEHQPNFLIMYKLSKSDQNGSYDIENYVIENVGEPMASPPRISCRSFIEVEYTDNNANSHKSAYYPLTYYHCATSSTGEMYGTLQYTVKNEMIKNHGKFGDLYFEALNFEKLHRNVYVNLNKVDMFEISYVDIYEENRTVYYRGRHRTTKKQYDEIMAYAQNADLAPKSIENVTLDDLVDFVLAQ